MQIKNYILIICFTLFVCGCFRNYDVYGFKPVKKNFDSGVVGARLIGSESIKGNTIIKRSPYKLFLWFGSETFTDGSLYIENLKLVNKKNGDIVFAKNRLLEKINQETDGYYANFLVENIKLPYENLKLQITFQFKQEEEASKKYKISLLLRKNHQKFKRIIGV